MKHAILSVLVVSFLSLLLNSCNTGGDKPAEVKQEPSSPINELAEFKFTFTIANLPPPMQILDEFSKSGLPANTGLMNATFNAGNYHSSNKKAFNYGIYGIDLAYAVFYERTPEILKYYPVVKQLADELDMAQTFNRFSERFRANSEDRDSLARIVDEVYAATDEYLRTNERLMTASVVLAGSWLEAQHLTVNSLLNVERTPQNEKLFQRVWEQRVYLDNINKILEEFQDDEELLQIKTAYENLLPIYREPADSKEVTQEFLVKLSKNIEEVRNKIIS